MTFILCEFIRPFPMCIDYINLVRCNHLRISVLLNVAFYYLHCFLYLFLYSTANNYLSFYFLKIYAHLSTCVHIYSYTHINYCLYFCFFSHTPLVFYWLRTRYIKLNIQGFLKRNTREFL